MSGTTDVHHVGLSSVSQPNARNLRDNHSSLPWVSYRRQKVAPLPSSPHYWTQYMYYFIRYILCVLWKVRDLGGRGSGVVIKMAAQPLLAELAGGHVLWGGCFFINTHQLRVVFERLRLVCRTQILVELAPGSSVST